MHRFCKCIDIESFQYVFFLYHIKCISISCIAQPDPGRDSTAVGWQVTLQVDRASDVSPAG